jgi:hypothetical protein
VGDSYWAKTTVGIHTLSNVGVGTTNSQYIFTVTDTGTPATIGLTNCLADYTTNANSYGQVNLRNISSGTNASADIIITADNGNDSLNFIDLGINNSGYSVGSWTINGANDGYLYTSDGNLSIGAINASVAKYISFFTGGTLISNERMRINSTGVGIGTTNISAAVTSANTAVLAAGIVTAYRYYGDGSQLSGVSGGITVSDDTSTNATRYVLFDDATSGSVSTVNVSSSKLTFNPSTGTLSATVFTSLSDRTQKTDITPITNAIETVKQIQGVKYKWVDDHSQPSIGVIAQEIEKVLPEVVTTNDQGLKTVSYGNIVGLLIEAIKEQQVRIEELERKLDV